MAIPEQQLKVWSNQGAVQTSALTHTSVRNCIDKAQWNTDINYKTYLQGSYPNYTNIYGNSDVDLIVEFRSIFTKNLVNLPQIDIDRFNSHYSDAKYTLQSFKTAVIKQLTSCYGEKNVVVGDKAILVKGDDNRLDCDVLVCNPYRKYSSFNIGREEYIEGIVFKTEETNKTIINYPKQHLSNGSLKNSLTNEKYKPSIRILKNIKARMIEKGYITKEIAPSYFLECLLYNSSNNNFQNSFADTFYSILKQFHQDLQNNKIEDYLVQNCQRRLFGNEDQQWNIINARLFINKLIEFWNNFD